MSHHASREATRRSVPVRALVVLLIMAAMTLAWSTPAQAHTDLISSDPADGSQLTGAPSEIELTFNEPVATRFVRVALTIDGEPMEEQPLRTSEGDGTRVVAFLDASQRPEAGQRARWRVDYRVSSGDGHPVTGSVRFTVRGTQTEAPTGSSSGAASGDPHRSDTPDPQDSAGDDAGGVSAVALTALGVLGLGIPLMIGLAVARLLRTRRREDPPA